MSFCCSCTEAIPDGGSYQCIGCQKLIHTWCGVPCPDQGSGKFAEAEVIRACFACYKGIYGVEYSTVIENGVEPTKENPLKRSTNSTESTVGLLSSLNNEETVLETSNPDSSFANLEKATAINDEIKANSSAVEQTEDNITLDTYFEFSEDRRIGFAKCKLCNKNKVIAINKYSYTSVKYHLERYHPNEYQLYIKLNPLKKKKVKRDLTKTDFSSPHIQSFSKLEAVRYAVRFSASENLSLHHLENKFFQEIFQRSIRPTERKGYTGRSHFIKDFSVYYNESCLEKIRILSYVDSKISITTDVWSSPNQESFLGITAHWISSRFNLHSMLLCFIPVNKLHVTTGLHLIIEACLKTYNIQNKVLGISLDASASNLAVMEQFDASTVSSIFKRNHSPCLAHIFHLAAQAFVSTIKQTYNQAEEFPFSFFYEMSEILDSTSGSKKKVNTTLYGVVEGDIEEDNFCVAEDNFIFRVSDLGFEEKNLANINSNQVGVPNSIEVSHNLNPISKLIDGLEQLRLSPSRRSEFIKLQQFKDIKPSVVVLDVKSRWNSLLKLIDWAILNKDPLTYFMVQEKVFFNDSDWELILEVKKFLYLFDEKINSVLSQKSTTISKALLAYEEVLLLIKEISYPEGSILNEALTNCHNKLLKFSSSLKNDIHVMGITLDPSLKDTFYMAYNWSEKDKEEARLKMMRIYEEYSGPVQVQPNTTTLNFIKKPRAIAFRESIRPIVENELKKYLSDLSDLDYENLLSYWKLRSSVFPTLGKIARDYLTVSATSMPIADEFSYTKPMFDSRNVNTDPESTARFMEMKSWESQSNQFSYMLPIPVAKFSYY